MSEMHERLREARKNAGFRSAKLAAERFGWTYSTYAGHENGSRNFEAKEAAGYAKALKVSPEWLLFGRSEQPIELEEGEVPPLNSRLVPLYDVQASAGFGSIVNSEDHVSNLAFSKPYLKEMTSAGQNDLAVIRVKGDSMEPTLLDDDIVLIDMTKTNLDYDGMFVLRYGEALHVKRIGRARKRDCVTVTSDNDEYPALDVERADLDVVGKVLWYGRKV